jgi:hypothetical protein
VTFFGATCDKVLPAVDLDDFPVAPLERTVDAAFAACVPVTFAPVAADCARAAKLFFATPPPLDFAVALWIRAAAWGVIGAPPLPLPFVAMRLSLVVEKVNQVLR